MTQKLHGNTEGSLYIFLGPDRTRKRERIAILAQELGVDVLDQEQIRGPLLAQPALAAAMRQQPVASPVRLLIVEDAERLPAPCVSMLDDAGWREQAACVVLDAEGPLQAGHPLAVLKDAAVVETFAWLSVPETQRWITGYAARCRKQVAPDVSPLLIQACGADTVALGAVLDQLINWVGSRPQITAADVRVFLTPPPPVNSFALVNAIAQRDAAAAVQACHDQFAAGKDPLELLGLVVWQVQRWWQVAHLLRAGYSEQRIEAVTGIKAWQVGRLRGEIAGRSVEELSRWLRRCWELDVAGKQGRVPVLRVAVETLVVQLCLSVAGSASRSVREVSSPGLSPVAA